MKRLLTHNHHPVNKDRLALWTDYRLTGSVAALGTVREYSGKGNHGALVNNAFVDNQGVNLDGSNDYVIIPDSADWDLFTSTSTGATLSIWIQHATHVGTEYYISHRESGTKVWTLLHTHGSGLRFYVYSGSLKIDTGSAAEIADNNWHMINMVKNGTTYKMYKDGINTASVVSSNTDSFTGPLYFGQVDVGAGEFAGTMGQRTIYKRALSAGEIKQLYLKNRRN